MKQIRVIPSSIHMANGNAKDKSVTPDIKQGNELQAVFVESPGRPKGSVLAALALLSVAAIWGSTFFLIKEILNELAPLEFLAVRFTLAAILGNILFFPRIRQSSWPVWKQGGVLGAVYFLAQVFQTQGLRSVDASVSGFLTGMYVVFTPILLFLIFRERIAARTVYAVLVATIGLAVLSLNGFSIGAGEMLTLLGAVMFALHIVLLAKWATKYDVLTLAVVQLNAIAVCSIAVGLPQGLTLPQTSAAWISLLYMTLFAALGAMVLQTWAQSRINAATAALIMLTEPIFASTFAILLGGENLSLRLCVGGALMLGAMLLTELGEDLEPRKLRKSFLSMKDRA